MARKTKTEALETREHILEASAKIFVCKGVAKSSLDEIAKLAGVTRGAVYWHFKNKNDLFEALHDSFHQPLTDAVMNDLSKDHPQPLQQLEELCVNLLLDIEKNEQKQRILRIFLLKCDYSGDMTCVLEKQGEQMQNSLKLFAKYFAKAKEKGHLPAEFDPDALALGLICYLTGIVHKYLRHPEIVNIQKQSPQLMRQFFHGMNH